MTFLYRSQDCEVVTTSIEFDHSLEPVTIIMLPFEEINSADGIEPSAELFF